MHTITAAPFKTPMSGNGSNFSLMQASECPLQEAYCTLQGPGHSLDGLKDECVLWDSTCSGNKSLAITQFYNSVAGALQKNSCFRDSLPECSKNNPVGRMSAFDEVKSWMRSPGCGVDERLGFEQIDDGPEHIDGPLTINEYSYVNSTCCGICIIYPDQADVYYWPDAHANTSCLSIVGDEISDLAAGATTGEGGTVYWGCTSRDSSQASGVGSPHIVTTAILTSIASLTFRTYLYNPWMSLPCKTSSTPLSSDLHPKVKPRDTRPSILPRGHSLVAPNASVSTAVLGNFTL